jgi:hypothetical protein
VRSVQCVTNYSTYCVICDKYCQVWAGLVLCNFFLCDFAVTRLENLHHFQIYALVFSLTQFGLDKLWLHFSYVGGWQKVTSLSHHESRVWIEYVGDIIMQLI